MFSGLKNRANLRPAFTLVVTAATALPTAAFQTRSGLTPIAQSFDSSNRGLPTPPATGSRRLPAGSNPAMVGRKPPPFNSALALRQPTATEVKRAGGQISSVLTQLGQVAATISPGQVRTILPQLSPNQPWVPPGTVTVSGRKYALGAVIITTDLVSIRNRERDFVRYQREFSAQYRAVYATRHDHGVDTDGNPYTVLVVHQSQKGQFGCFGLTSDFHSLEHWIGNRLVVDYYGTGSRLYYMKGRDTYYPIVDEHGFYGYLVVTLFGFDITWCGDGDSDMRQAVLENLAFTASAVKE